MKQRYSVPSYIEPLYIFGVKDNNLRIIEKHLRVKMYPNHNTVTIIGEQEEVEAVINILDNILKIAQETKSVVSEEEVNLIINKIKRDGTNYNIDSLMTKGILVSSRGKYVKPKTLGQAEYLKTMMEKDITFAIGPAGTGKTYLATALALNYLQTKRVSRIILTRPAVEAGESIGFLPGDIEEKVSPYLRPLYDSIFDMLGPDEYQELFEKGIIEIAPLAFMRGRTLNNAFVILDEAQNTTPEQMKMFLTRLGFGSKMVITGDVTQTDLPKHKESGLKQAERLFKNIEGIAIVYLTQEDVVRHELVKKIIDVYEKAEAEKYKKKEKIESE